MSAALGLAIIRRRDTPGWLPARRADGLRLGTTARNSHGSPENRLPQVERLVALICRCDKHPPQILGLERCWSTCGSRDLAFAPPIASYGWRSKPASLNSSPTTNTRPPMRNAGLRSAGLPEDQAAQRGRTRCPAPADPTGCGVSAGPADGPKQRAACAGLEAGGMRQRLPASISGSPTKP